jgi:hypothetical protein
LCGAGYALVTLENFWYGGFMLLATAIFVAVSVLWKIRLRERFTARGVMAAVFAMLVGAAIITPWVLPLVRGCSEGKEPIWPEMRVYARGVEDVVKLAARPIDYVRPSSMQPIWGEKFGSTEFVHERTIYVGAVLVVLAILGIFVRRKGFATAFFCALALAAFLISLEPVARHLHILAPPFRGYARLGVLVVMSLCVLAALGCERIFGGRRGFLFPMVLGLVLLDFAYLPWEAVTNVSRVPEVYKWLEGQDGDFIVAEIPTSRFTNYDRFYQRFHGKRVLSNDRLDQAADLSAQFDIDESRVLLGGRYAEEKERELFARHCRRLAGYGVKYLIVRLRDPFPGNPVLKSFVREDADMTMRWSAERIASWSPGLLEEEKRFAAAVVYKVIAPPMKIIICAGGESLVIGGEDVPANRGAAEFDILLRPGGGGCVAEIKLASDTPLEGLIRVGDFYLLPVPLEGIETRVIIGAAAGAKIKIEGISLTPR